MSGERGAPASDAHQFVKSAYAAINEPSTIWRLRYNLPPNHPHLLAMTEEEVLSDLLTLAYYDEDRARRIDPTPPEAYDPEVTKTYEDRKKAVLESDLMTRLGRLLRGKPEKPTMSVRVRGWSQ